MKILVTGGAGYIGSAVAAALLADGHSVTIFDNFSTGQSAKVPVGATTITGDITDQAALRAALTPGFDVVLHCAAKKAVGESQTNPGLYFETNVVGTLNLLQAMAETKTPRIVFSSTAAIYAPTDTPVTELSALGPASIYGQSKQMAENLIKAYTETGQIASFACLRYFNVAGDAGLDYCEDKAANVFPILARAIKTQKPFNIFGTDYDTKDGTCVRDYIHLRDLVSAHVAAITGTTTGILNLGTGSGYSVRELVAAFAEALGQEILVQESARRPGDTPVVVADATLAKQTLNWTPKHTLRDMVEDTLRIYR